MKDERKSVFDFGGSDKVDPTPGGIPFMALIAVFFPLLIGLLAVIYWYFF